MHKGKEIMCYREIKLFKLSQRGKCRRANKSELWALGYANLTCQREGEEETKVREDEQQRKRKRIGGIWSLIIYW